MKLRSIAVCAVAACSYSTAATLPELPPSSVAATALAIVDVSVIPMDAERLLAHQTVMVRDGRIEWIGDTGTRSIPGDAVVIPGQGRFLMPALADMHVHMRRSDLAAYLRNGITTVRNMWGHTGLPSMMADIASGAVPGPTIHTASPGVDGTPPQWPQTVLVTSLAEVEDSIAALKARGFRWLKVYSRLEREVFDSVMRVARSSGMLPIGHVPFQVDLRSAIETGMHSIEHLTGYDRAISLSHQLGISGWADPDPSRFAELVQVTVEHGVWNCPTLAIYAELTRRNEHPSRDAIIRNRRTFVKELFDAGARLLVGSDAGIDVVPAGTSLHEELAEFARSGLSPYEALRIATVNAAEFLERPSLGTVATGMDAELLLLNANPLADIRNARAIAGIVMRGAWIPASSLTAGP